MCKINKLTSIGCLVSAGIVLCVAGVVVLTKIGSNNG